MVDPERGFRRNDLQARYEISSIREDEWHSYTDSKTSGIIAAHLTHSSGKPGWLLNAGAGVYEIGNCAWQEVSLDLFVPPITGRKYGVCANVEKLPFAISSFHAVICVGEVLAYCDPAKAISEFARIMVQGGLLICDFGNSRSLKHLFKDSFGRTAGIISDEYNGSQERTWVYDQEYIESLLETSEFNVAAKYGTHTLSALARRFGVSTAGSVALQRRFEWMHASSRWADLITMVAVRGGSGREL